MTPSPVLEPKAHSLFTVCPTFLWSCWETPMRRHKDRKCWSQSRWFVRFTLSGKPLQVVRCDLALRQDKLRIPQNLLWLVESVIVLEWKKSNPSHVQIRLWRPFCLVLESKVSFGEPTDVFTLVSQNSWWRPPWWAHVHRAAKDFQSLPLDA